MHAAVFVDFENLYLSLQHRAELSGQRPRELSLAILEALKARLQAQGMPMVLGRSYAAFDAYPGMEVAHDLALMGLDPQYVLVGHAGKNSADVQLTVDACRVLFRRPDIDAIVIVSGDRDFIPVARQVLEENKELLMVAIPDTASGDLRMRVGSERLWNALELLPAGMRAGAAEAARPANGSPGSGGDAAAAPLPVESAAAPAPTDPAPARTAPRPLPRGARVVGHIPVTWRLEEVPEDELLRRLALCLDLVVRAQVRHGSAEVWLSPFLKGPLSQHFSSLVHPERRALINELRHRGAIRVEERENQYADHPYSVIVLDPTHPLTQAALERHRRRGDHERPVAEGRADA